MVINFINDQSDPALSPNPHRQARAYRQIHWKFSNMRERIKQLDVKLETISATPEPTYRCTMTAHLPRGTRRETSIEGRWPNICIADTTARLARLISRESKLGRQARYSL